MGDGRRRTRPPRPYEKPFNPECNRESDGRVQPPGQRHIRLEIGVDGVSTVGRMAKMNRHYVSRSWDYGPDRVHEINIAAAITKAGQDEEHQKLQDERSRDIGTRRQRTNG